MGELQRSFTLARVRCLSDLSMLKPHMTSNNAPRCLRARALHRAALPAVGVLDMSDQQREGAVKRRMMEGEGEGARREMTRAVARFVLCDLSRDLFVELIQSMRPA
jgi:hypothetical protein